LLKQTKVGPLSETPVSSDTAWFQQASEAAETAYAFKYDDNSCSYELAERKSINRELENAFYVVRANSEVFCRWLKTAFLATPPRVLHPPDLSSTSSAQEAQNGSCTNVHPCQSLCHTGRGAPQGLWLNPVERDKRNRHEIKKALQDLRSHIPFHMFSKYPPATLEILKQAATYIRMLDILLSDPEG